MNRTAEMIEENASNSFAEADIKKVLGYIKQTGEKGIKLSSGCNFRTGYS